MSSIIAEQSSNFLQIIDFDGKHVILNVMKSAILMQSYHYEDTAVAFKSEYKNNKLLITLLIALLLV